LGNLADEGLKVLNRAAEDAVKTATPIFVKAVKEITFKDAKNILFGDTNAATSYLQTKTAQNLQQSFRPIIDNSFSKVGAAEVWNNLISKYNAIPFVKKVNPDLTGYVTTEALNGVFTMIAIEEKGIREKINLRNSTLLKQVFALQDNK
jgi:enolase